MTERTSKTLKRAGLVSLATLMVFGNWLLEKVEHARAGHVHIALNLGYTAAVSNYVVVALKKNGTIITSVDGIINTVNYQSFSFSDVCNGTDYYEIFWNVAGAGTVSFIVN